MEAPLPQQQTPAAAEVAPPVQEVHQAAPTAVFPLLTSEQQRLERARKRSSHNIYAYLDAKFLDKDRVRWYRKHGEGEEDSKRARVAPTSWYSTRYSLGYHAADDPLFARLTAADCERTFDLRKNYWELDEQEEAVIPGDYLVTPGTLKAADAIDKFVTEELPVVNARWRELRANFLEELKEAVKARDDTLPELKEMVEEQIKEVQELHKELREARERNTAAGTERRAKLLRAVREVNKLG